MNYDVIIVGGGIMGLCSAYSLSKEGYSICIIDKYGLNNRFQSSHDYTRNYRVEYGGNTSMELLAEQAGTLRREFECANNIKILKNTGSLYLGNIGDNETKNCFTSMEEHNHKVKRLDSKYLSTKYCITAGYGFVDIKGGVLDAKKIIEQLIIDLGRNDNVSIITGTVTSFASGVVKTKNDIYTAERIIIAPGSRSNGLLEKGYGITTTPEKQICVNFFGENTEKYKDIPMFIYPESGFYGGYVSHINAIKIVTHSSGLFSNDIENNRIIENEQINSAKKFINQLFLDNKRKIHSSSSCFYNRTSNDNFIVDVIGEGIYVCTGGSGHAFKFGLLIGEYVASLITENDIKNSNVMKNLRSLKNQ